VTAAVPIRAVTFDHWATLVRDRGGIRSFQVAAWEEVLADVGLPVSREDLERAFEENWQVFEARWRENVQHGPAPSTPVILQHLGLEVSDEVRARLVRAFDEAGERADLEVATGIAETLATLRDDGVRIGIVCDVGLTPSPVLRDRLEGFGLLAAFDHWSFSDEVDCFKPFPGIFAHALEGLGAPEPAEVAHVGDQRRTDVAGARAFGMASVRYTGFVDDPPAHGPEADAVLEDHRDLPGLLRRLA
jgi:HAD superfamily hydrolase (TIGR01549 family)